MVSQESDIYVREKSNQGRSGIEYDGGRIGKGPKNSCGKQKRKPNATIFKGRERKACDIRLAIDRSAQSLTAFVYV